MKDIEKEVKLLRNTIKIQLLIQIKLHQINPHCIC